MDVSPPKPAVSKLPSLGIAKPGTSRIPGSITPSKERVKEEKDEVKYGVIGVKTTTFPFLIVIHSITVYYVVLLEHICKDYRYKHKF